MGDWHQHYLKTAVNEIVGAIHMLNNKTGSTARDIGFIIDSLHGKVNRRVIRDALKLAVSKGIICYKNNLYSIRKRQNFSRRKSLLNKKTLFHNVSLKKSNQSNRSATKKYSVCTYPCMDNQCWIKSTRKNTKNHKKSKTRKIHSKNRSKSYVESCCSLKTKFKLEYDTMENSENTVNFTEVENTFLDCRAEDTTENKKQDEIISKKCGTGDTETESSIKSKESLTLPVHDEAEMKEIDFKAELQYPSSSFSNLDSLQLNKNARKSKYGLVVEHSYLTRAKTKTPQCEQSRSESPGVLDNNQNEREENLENPDNSI